MFYEYNKKYTFILLLLIIIPIQSNEIQKKIIVVPFKSYYPIINEKEDLVKYIGSMIKRKLFWESENEDGQKIPIIMTLKWSSMHTSDSVAYLWTDETIEYYYKQNDICNFNYKKSKNYKCVTPYNKSFSLKSKLCYAKEKFRFYTDTQMANTNFYDMEFIHTVNNTETCFFDGLQITTDKKDKELNFFIQLKNLIKSKSYAWMLKFNSADEGYFIFGDIINNKNIEFMKDINTVDNYESIYVKPFSSGTIFWKLSFDYLYLGENVMAINFEINIEISSQFIRVPDKIFSRIKRIYFSNYFNYNFQDGNPVCFEKYVFAKFKGVYCKKKELLNLTNNLKDLPEFNLYSPDFHINITFKPEELFREYNNTLFFLVGHDTQLEKNEWNIGSILLQKYTIVFDPESKRLNLLKYINVINNVEKKVGNKGDIYIAIFLTLIITAIVFCFFGLRYGKKIYQSRKKKANELNDGYDYSTYKEIENKRRIIPNDINSKMTDKGIEEYTLEMTKTK